MGLTRFNLPPDPSQQPSRNKRSQSHPRLNDIVSRLNQETQSFASKKTKARRSVSKSPVVKKRQSLVSYPISPRNKTQPQSPSKQSGTVVKGIDMNLQLENAIEVAAQQNKSMQEKVVSNKEDAQPQDKKSPAKTKRKVEKKSKTVVKTEKVDEKKIYDEKASKDCPSYLIWSIFTRKREMQKVQNLERKPNNSKGKKNI